MFHEPDLQSARTTNVRRHLDPRLTSSATRRPGNTAAGPIILAWKISPWNESQLDGAGDLAPSNWSMRCPQIMRRPRVRAGSQCQRHGQREPGQAQQDLPRSWRVAEFEKTVDQSGIEVLPSARRGENHSRGPVRQQVSSANHRVNQRHPEGPARLATARRTHPSRRFRPCHPTPHGHDNRDLAQQPDRPSHPPPTERLRPPTPWSYSSSSAAA